MKYNVDFQEPNKKLYLIQNERLVERRQGFIRRTDVGEDALISTDGTIILAPAEERSPLVPRLVLCEVNLDEEHRRAKLTPASPVVMQQRITPSLAVTQGLTSTTTNLTVSQVIYSSLRESMSYWSKPREKTQSIGYDAILESCVTQSQAEEGQPLEAGMNEFVYYPPFNAKATTAKAVYPSEGLLCTCVPVYCMEHRNSLSYEYIVNFVKPKAGTEPKAPKKGHTIPSPDDNDKNDNNDAMDSDTSEEFQLNLSVELDYTPYAQRIIQRQKRTTYLQNRTDETRSSRGNDIYRKEGSIHYIQWDENDPDAPELLRKLKNSPYVFIKDAYLNAIEDEQKDKSNNQLLCLLACFQELSNSFRSQKIVSTRFATFLSTRYSGKIEDDVLKLSHVPDLLPYICVLALHLSFFNVNLTALGEILLRSPSQLAKIYSGLMCRIRKQPNGDYVVYLKPPLHLLRRRGFARNLGSK